MSAWAMISPENNIETYGEMRPKSRFLGNSAATIMVRSIVPFLLLDSGSALNVALTLIIGGNQQRQIPRSARRRSLLDYYAQHVRLFSSSRAHGHSDDGDFVRYARGILFGKVRLGLAQFFLLWPILMPALGQMVLELGDQCYVKNENHDYVCDLDFKTKVSLDVSALSRLLLTTLLHRDSFLVLVRVSFLLQKLQA